MKLINKTRGTTLTNNLKEAKSLKDKTFGLHLSSNPRSLLFKTRFGIQTFFLKDAIDVLVLTDKFSVAKKSTVEPNSIYIYPPKYQIVIELPSGTISRTNTQIGDKLSI